MKKFLLVAALTKLSAALSIHTRSDVATLNTLPAQPSETFAAASSAQNSRATTGLPSITLDYSTVRAAASGNNSAGTYYLFENIRFAASPTGDLRFQAPQDPVAETAVNNGTWDSEGTQGCSVAEDCLFLDVWVPEFALNGGQQLPVVVWNYGGGWVGGSKNEASPEGLFAASDNGLIFVAFNYRLDIFGLLQGPTYQRAGGVSNVAVYDARKAMEWTHKYISFFGGDAENISNWGFSAGGSQVAVSLTAFGGLQWTPPFKRAIINSPGWVPGAGHAQAERFFLNVSTQVNCTTSTTYDDLNCLRQTTFADLLAASETVQSSYGYQMQPRVDAVVLPDTSEYLFGINRFHPNLTVLLGHSSDESSPKLAGTSISNDTGVHDALRSVFPGITDWALEQIDTLYPITEYDSYSDKLKNISKHYDLVAKVLPATNAYGNQTFNFISNLGSAGHGSDQSYWFYYPNSNSSIQRTSTSSSGGSSTGSGSGNSASTTMSGQMSSSTAASGASNSAYVSASAAISVASGTGSGGQGNSSDSSTPPSGSSGFSGGQGTGGSSTMTDKQVEVALQMQKWLINFIKTGSPNDDSAADWPSYGSSGQVMAFNDDGYSLVEDELDSDQVKFWNHAYWY